MSKAPQPGNGRSGGVTGSELTVSALFTILWDALADLLGTAATATLLKRAARRGATRNPELGGLVIERNGVVYRYTCPSAWDDKSEGTPLALRELVCQLRPLLVEMTGQIVLQHLEKALELRERGLFGPREEQK